MAIVIKLEAVMSQYGISLDHAAEKVGITNVNLSRIKTGKIVSARFSTVDALVKAIRELGFDECNVGDILCYVPDEDLDNLQEGVYVSTPKALHGKSNPISQSAKEKLKKTSVKKHRR